MSYLMQCFRVSHLVATYPVASSVGVRGLQRIVTQGSSHLKSSPGLEDTPASSPLARSLSSLPCEFLHRDTHDREVSQRSNLLRNRDRERESEKETGTINPEPQCLL